MMHIYIVVAIVILFTSLVDIEAMPSDKTSQSCDVLSNITAFFVDLDGTMYVPGGLLPGARSFVQWMQATNKSFVFLSNSGAKGAEGVQAKFLTPPYKLQDKPIGLEHCHTSADALAKWLSDTAPQGARIFIVQAVVKYGSTIDSFTRIMKRSVPPELLESWDWRTDMNETEIVQWAHDSHFNKHPTFVVFSNDGQISDEADPVTGKAGYSDWSYSLFSKAQQLLENGAILANQAPDSAPWPSRKNGLILDTPGPGPFVQLLKSAIYPKDLNSTYCTGKGGNLGSKYMYEKGLEQLRLQGFTGSLQNMAMVGDVLNTDMKGGQDFGINSFLVLSGCGDVSQERYFPNIKPPTCVFGGVGDIPNSI